MQLADNASLVIICAILALAALLFFAVIYLVDFQENRIKSKKRRDQRRAFRQAQKRKRNPGGSNVLSGDS